MTSQLVIRCDQCGDDGMLPDPNCPVCDGTGILNPIAGALKTLRANTPYSQREVAEMLDIRQERYGAMERGAARMYNIQELLKLAELTHSHLVVRFDRYE